MTSSHFARPTAQGRRRPAVGRRRSSSGDRTRRDAALYARPAHDCASSHESRPPTATATCPHARGLASSHRAAARGGWADFAGRRRRGVTAREERGNERAAGRESLVRRACCHCRRRRCHSRQFRLISLGSRNELARYHRHSCAAAYGMDVTDGHHQLGLDERQQQQQQHGGDAEDTAATSTFSKKVRLTFCHGQVLNTDPWSVKQLREYVFDDKMPLQCWCPRVFVLVSRNELSCLHYITVCECELTVMYKNTEEYLNYSIL